MGICGVSKRAIFLDRDGVLNHAVIIDGKPYPPRTVEEVTLPADALSALRDLKAQGYLLIGATNQPDVARGITSKSLIEAINQKIMSTLPLDEMRVCYHDDKDGCKCRKPFPGLLTQAAEEHDIDLSRSFMIGDRWKDVEAGRRAGCKTVWLNFNYQEEFKSAAPDLTAKTLTEAKKWIQMLHAE